MKKLLVLLTVAMAFFVFTTGASAQLLDVCTPCPKCEVGSILCPQSGQDITPTCSYFDYETGVGYSSGRGTGNCHAVFAICNCLSAATSFVAGHRIGVRMTILVDGLAGQRGAYWSAPGTTDIAFAMFAHQADACAATAYTSSFGTGKWYKTNSSGTATDEVTGLASNSSCAPTSGQQATQIITDPDKGYTITLADETAKLSYWWIDIPYIRINPSVLHNGELISVKIETLDQSTGGICADCVATCECIVDVARVCPTSGSSGSTCLYPYFSSTTEATDAQPFWNGIVVTNTSSIAGTATLTVHQQDGKAGTYTTPSIPAGSMFVQALENIGFSGTGLGDLPVYITVTTTFPSMDGFAIIANTATGESMGYLCRKPCD